jgi:hypothetical protein
VERDADAPPVQRTPTGQMYSFPPAKDDVKKGQATGSVDIGFTNDSDKTNYAKRKEYADTRDGVTINNFGLAADTDGARYFTINGGGVNRTDQFYDVTVGKYNSWKVKTFYNETTHVFTDTYKSLYNGIGTGSLTNGLNLPVAVTSGIYTAGAQNFVGDSRTCTALAPCWSYNGKVYGGASTAAGGSTAAQILTSQQANAILAINGVIGTPNATTGLIPTASGANATGAHQTGLAAAIAQQLNQQGYSELSLARKKAGARADITLNDNWKGYVSYNLETRKGARPFSTNDNNTSIEIAEPIDYKTHDILAGTTYNDGQTQFNLRASASLFRNSIKQLDVQDALLSYATPAGAIQHSSFALSPDSDSYNLKGEFAHNLPDLMKARFTASASLGSNRQNDKLLMPISAIQSADLANAGVTSFSVANPGYGTAYLGTTGTPITAANAATVAAQVNNWNGVNGNPLSRTTADQRIDNRLVNLGFSLKPVDDLDMKASYRFYETLNKGGYMAYNPLTGQFGRGMTAQSGSVEVIVAPNGSGGCYAPAGYAAVAGCSTLASVMGPLVNGNNTPVFGLARSTRQSNYGLTADYDLGHAKSLNASVEREDVYRTNRERDKTEENMVKLGYVDRSMGDATLRVSYEKDTKRGSDYNYRPWNGLGQGLPGLTVADILANINAAGAGQTVGGVTYPSMSGTGSAAGIFTMYSNNFRKYDLADRDQSILNTRVNYAAREDLDVGLNMQVKRIAYNEAIYGVRNDKQDSLGVDMNYQPTFDTTVTVFYNYQKAEKIALYNAGTGTATTCTNAILAQYGYSGCSDTITGADGLRPDSSKWSSDTTDYNNVLGLGFQNDLGFARLGVDYTFARGSTHIAYKYSANAFSATAANNSAMMLLAGTALPNMTTEQNTLTFNLVKPLDKKTTIRGMYRFDGFRVKDWHYDGVIHNAMTAMDGNTLLLDSGAMNYHVNTFGVFLNYKL